MHIPSPDSFNVATTFDSFSACCLVKTTLAGLLDPQQAVVSP
jgi:hypothetical protein